MKGEGRHHSLVRERDMLTWAETETKWEHEALHVENNYYRAVLAEVNVHIKPNRQKYLPAAKTLNCLLNFTAFYGRTRSRNCGHASKISFAYILIFGNLNAAFQRRHLPCSLQTRCCCRTADLKFEFTFLDSLHIIPIR